jgi:hypothetical protein
MFQRTIIGMINKPTDVKYIKALKAFHTSTNVIKFDGQKKKSRDSISFPDQVPICDYCYKRGYLVQACRAKVADKTRRAGKFGKSCNND